MESELYAAEPAHRLAASARLRDKDRRKIVARSSPDWPGDSPGAVNAWLLLVTTKPPSWRDPYIMWRDVPPTVGEPHEGFFYPDPLGFWAEVRHWSTVTIGLGNPDALCLTTVLHGADRLEWALDLMQPRVVLFLDEPAWQKSPFADAPAESWEIPDPYRAQQVYEGWWAETAEGLRVGKAPQHPAAHRLYERQDMDTFLTRQRVTEPAPAVRSS
jgi:hypothetical protein